MKTTPSRKSVSQAGEPVSDLFQKLEALEKEMDAATHTGHSRWMIPYADLLTLLLGLFLVLFTASAKPEAKQNPESKQIAVQNSQNTLKNSQKPPIDAKAREHQTSAHQPDQQRETALAATLQKEIRNGLNMKDVIIRRQERGLVISLKDSILFEPGSADLSYPARKTLDRLAAQLAAALNGESRPIRVEGHTDNTPITTAKYPSNWELSTARATNIVRYLIASHHFSPADLSAAGYGQFRPVEDNSSIEGKQKNRRVDIVILNDSTAQQEPPPLPQSPKSRKGQQQL
jgi:chemotaxis protein MotB